MKLSREDIETSLIERHTEKVHDILKNSVVGIAGLGGLGSNIAVALARAGVGRLILADFDKVDISNLNRQYYFIKHLGMKKTEAITDILTNINPYIELITHDIYLNNDNIMDIFHESNIVVEAFDNPDCKAEIVNTILSASKDKIVVAASGMAGYYPSNLITTKKVTDRFYLIGDGTSAIEKGDSLMAPRVAIAANHQANMVLRLLLGSV